MNTQVLEQLLRCARETLEASPNPPSSQVIVLKTVKGHTYCFSTPSFTEAPEAFASTEDQIVEALGNQKDTAVEAMVTMWADGCVDLPSFHFRQKLVALDPRNLETEMPLMAAEGTYAVRTIGACMPE